MPDILANPDWTDLLAEFSAAGVRALIVGGVAYGIHAEPRATKDIDLWVESSPLNAQRVLAALTAFGAPLVQHGVTQETFTTPEMVYQMGLPPNRIDVLTMPSSVPFDAAEARSLDTHYNGVPVKVIGLRDLIATKTGTGRDQDRVDVEMLRRAEGATLSKLPHPTKR